MHASLFLLSFFATQALGEVYIDYPPPVVSTPPVVIQYHPPIQTVPPTPAPAPAPTAVPIKVGISWEVVRETPASQMQYLFGEIINTPLSEVSQSDLRQKYVPELESRLLSLIKIQIAAMNNTLLNSFGFGKSNVEKKRQEIAYNLRELSELKLKMDLLHHSLRVLKQDLSGHFGQKVSVQMYSDHRLRSLVESGELDLGMTSANGLSRVLERPEAFSIPSYLGNASGGKHRAYYVFTPEVASFVRPWVAPIGKMGHYTVWRVPQAMKTEFTTFIAQKLKMQLGTYPRHAFASANILARQLQEAGLSFQSFRPGYATHEEDWEISTSHHTNKNTYKAKNYSLQQLTNLFPVVTDGAYLWHPIHQNVEDSLYPVGSVYGYADENEWSSYSYVELLVVNWQSLKRINSVIRLKDYLIARVEGEDSVPNAWITPKDGNKNPITHRIKNFSFPAMYTQLFGKLYRSQTMDPSAKKIQMKVNNFSDLIMDNLPKPIVEIAVGGRQLAVQNNKVDNTYFINAQEEPMHDLHWRAEEMEECHIQKNGTTLKKVYRNKLPTPQEMEVLLNQKDQLTLICLAMNGKKYRHTIAKKKFIAGRTEGGKNYKYYPQQ